MVDWLEALRFIHSITATFQDHLCDFLQQNTINLHQIVACPKAGPEQRGSQCPSQLVHMGSKAVWASRAVMYSTTRIYIVNTTIKMNTQRLQSVDPDFTDLAIHRSSLSWSESSWAIYTFPQDYVLYRRQSKKLNGNEFLESLTFEPTVRHFLVFSYARQRLLEQWTKRLVSY